MDTQNMNAQNLGIHCKVKFGEEFRRFVVKSADFKTLNETVKKLFNLSDGCVLKYKDDEGDYVTMSSDEELQSALDFSSGLLKLFVVNLSQPSETTFPGAPIPGNWHQYHHPGHPYQMGGPHPGHPHHQGHPQPHTAWEQKGCKKNKREKKMKKWEKKCGKKDCCGVRNPEILKKRIFWLTKKKAELEKRLSELDSLLVEGQLPPNLVQEQQQLERKVNGISCRLEKLSLLTSEHGKGQACDPENLPDSTPEKVILSDTDKDQLHAELLNLRENLLKSCFAAKKEAKYKLKFAQNALDSFSGVPESEGKRLIQEFETAKESFLENKKVLKSLRKREKELCNLLGIDKKEGKVKKEKSKKPNKKFKYHK